MFYKKILLDKNRIIITMFRYFPIQEEGPLEGYPVQGRFTLHIMLNIFKFRLMGVFAKKWFI